MAEIIRYVDPDASGAGNGTSWTDAYTSLNAWEAGEETNLVTDGDWHHCYVRASNGTSDTIATNIYGWTTGVNNYILIEAADGDEAIKTSLDSNRYIFANRLIPDEANIYIDGLQIEDPDTYEVSIVLNSAPGIIEFRNCRINCGNYAGLEGMEISDTSIDLRIYNCIFTGNARDFGIKINNSNSVKIYNNIIYGFTDGILIAGNENSVEIKNCAVFNNTDDFDDLDSSIIDYCASDDGDGTNAVSPSGGNWANEFTDAANGDFTLVSGGNCEDGGTDDPGSGLYSTDIEGDSYTSAWSIGVDEPAGGVTHTAAVVDGLKSGDTITIVKTVSPKLTDGIKAGEIPTVLKNIQVNVPDGTKFGDPLSAGGISAAQVIEGLKLGDPLTRLKILEALIPEGTKLGELTIEKATYYTVLLEGLKLGDFSTISGIDIVEIIDGLKLGDSNTRLKILEATISDGTKLGDLVTVVASVLVSVIEGLKFGDILTGDISGLLAGDIVDGIKLGETTSTLTTLLSALIDGIKFGDALTHIGLLSGSITEGIKTGDAFTRTLTLSTETIEGIKLGAEGSGGGETADIGLLDGEDAGSTPWEWDSITEDAGNTLALSAANPSHGDNSYEVAFGGSNDRAYGVYIFAGQTEIYFRFYFEFNQFGADTGEIRLLYLLDLGTGVPGKFYIQGTGAGQGIGYKLLHDDNIGQRTAIDHSTDEIFFPNIEYYIEIHWFAGSSNDGGIEAWIDGIYQGGETNRTNDKFTADQLWMGNIYSSWNPSAGTKYYFDDILLSTTGPIGAYTPSGAAFPDVQKTILPNLIDGFKSGDLITSTTKYITTTVDGIKLGESIPTLLSLATAIVEGIKLGEITVESISGLLTADIIEGIKLGDTQTALATLLAAITEGIKLGEITAADIKGLLSAAVVEGIKLGDTQTALVTLLTAITDGVKFGDATAQNLALLASVADEVKFGEDSSTTFRFYASATDGVKLGENIATILNLIAACTEGVNLGDAITGTFWDVYTGDISEGIKIGDEVTTQWVGAVGMVTISFSSRAAVITFTTRIPSIDFISRDPQITFST